MEQEYAQPRREREEHVVEELPQPHTSSQFDSVDALLDDIDAVLESNATSFVKGFVQKGGQ